MSSQPSPLSEIPEDGILHIILSSLSIKDAVRTSALAKRWSHLCSHLAVLDFDSDDILGPFPGRPHSWKEYYDDVIGLKEDEAALPVDFSFLVDRRDEELARRNWQADVPRQRMDKFVRAVDTVLQRHCGFGVERLRISYYLTDQSGCDIDRWVNFAIQSGTRELELNLGEEHQLLPIPSVGQYEFPSDLFGMGSSLERLRLNNCKFSLLPAEFIGFRCLKSLRLTSMFTTKEHIEALLSVCPVMESLELSFCVGIVGLCVSHRSGRMKHLSLSYCFSLEKLEFDSIIVSSFYYCGGEIRFYLKNASRIVKGHASITGTICCSNNCPITDLIVDLPQVETLSLSFVKPIKMRAVPNSCRFTQLKQLILFDITKKKCDLRELVFYLNLAPLLEEFHVHMSQCKHLDVLSSARGQQTNHPGSCSKANDILLLPSIHNNLKQFKMGGFKGQEEEISLVLSVFRSSAALELVIIDTSNWRYSSPEGWTRGEDVHVVEARAFREKADLHLSEAAQLAGVKLVIR